MADIGEPGRAGRRAKQDGLVRPYVLNAGDHAHPRPTQRAAGQRQTRGDQPALDWIGEVGSRGPREAHSEPTQRDEPTRPSVATASLPAAKPHRAGPRGRRRWLVAIGGVVAALAIAGGLTLFLSQPAKLLASACEAQGCRQEVSRPFGDAKPPDVSGSTRKALHRGYPTPPTATPPTARPWPSPTGSHPVPSPTGSSPGSQPTSPSPAPTSTPTSPGPTPTTTAPSASPTPSPTPTSSPPPESAQVSYTLVRKHPHSFQGRFTIVNNGSAAISGWELTVVLPGDHIHSVWDGGFHTEGNTLYIDPSSSQRTIAPGATLTENFIAGGSTTTPTSCTFNGAAC